MILFILFYIFFPPGWTQTAFRGGFGCPGGARYQICHGHEWQSEANPSQIQLFGWAGMFQMMLHALMSAWLFWDVIGQIKISLTDAGSESRDDVIFWLLCWIVGQHARVRCARLQQSACRARQAQATDQPSWKQPSGGKSTPTDSFLKRRSV